MIVKEIYDSSFAAKLIQRATDYPRLCGSFALKETELSILDAAGRATRAIPRARDDDTKTLWRRNERGKRERERERENESDDNFLGVYYARAITK